MWAAEIRYTDGIPIMSWFAVFLKSAAGHLTGKGNVAITAVNSPHYDGAFDVDGAAERNDYEIPVAYPFFFSDYPGYSHVKTIDDGSKCRGRG